MLERSLTMKTLNNVCTIKFEFNLVLVSNVTIELNCIIGNNITIYDNVQKVDEYIL